jgi:hypothetical protein
MTKKRMTELKYSNELVKDVSRLVELHLRFHGYGTGEWTDSAVRRYVRDAGPLLDRLHKLTRSDCTTRNKRKATALSRAYDGLEERIAQLQEQEELDAIRPDLDGNQIMEILGVAPGPVIGQAYKFLMELRLENGPMEYDAAVSALKEWWAAQELRMRVGVMFHVKHDSLSRTRTCRGALFHVKQRPSRLHRSYLLSARQSTKESDPSCQESAAVVPWTDWQASCARLEPSFFARTLWVAFESLQSSFSTVALESEPVLRRQSPAWSFVASSPPKK